MMEWTFENIIYVIAGVTFDIFCIRIILSLLGFDTEFDVDADFDIGDLISFKGFAHFLMGFSGWISLKFHYHAYAGLKTIVVAIGMGLLVMTLLYFIYFLLSKLDSPVKQLEPKKLIGRKAMIDSVISEKNHEYIINVTYDINSVSVCARSKREHRAGDEVVILDYKNKFYLI